MQSASDRAIDRHIRNKLREATYSRGFITSLLSSITNSPIPAPLPDIAESTTVSTDPHASYSFADRRLAPTLTDAVASNADSVEMTALQSATTGGRSRSLSTVSPMLTCNLDPAVLLRLHRQDELPQHFIAALLPDPPPGVGEGKTLAHQMIYWPAG